MDRKDGELVDCAELSSLQDEIVSQPGETEASTLSQEAVEQAWGGSWEILDGETVTVRRSKLRCTRCGAVFTVDSEVFFRFCPHCGAAKSKEALDIVEGRSKADVRPSGEGNREPPAAVPLPTGKAEQLSHLFSLDPYCRKQ